MSVQDVEKGCGPMNLGEYGLGHWQRKEKVWEGQECPSHLCIVQRCPEHLAADNQLVRDNKLPQVKDRSRFRFRLRARLSVRVRDRGKAIRGNVLALV